MPVGVSDNVSFQWRSNGGFLRHSYEPFFLIAFQLLAVQNETSIYNASFVSDSHFHGTPGVSGWIPGRGTKKNVVTLNVGHMPRPRDNNLSSFCNC